MAQHNTDPYDERDPNNGDPQHDPALDRGTPGSGAVPAAGDPGAATPGAGPGSPDHGGTASGTSSGSSDTDGRAHVVRLTAGDHLVTVNPVDGSEIQPCPPGDLTGTARRLTGAERPAAPAARPPHDIPLLERDDERERLRRMLSQGRSVRLTGPSGSGRSALLEAVAQDVARLAPDGVIRLDGTGRDASEVLHELFAVTHRAPGHRPEPGALREALRGVGAVVVLDDLEFGGTALDALLAATPECAFLFSARPEAPAPAADSFVEEVTLPGLSHSACLRLLEHAVRRPLTHAEAEWAAALRACGDGLPLHFVQAGALLRQQRDGALVGAQAPAAAGTTLPVRPADVVRHTVAGLPPAARETLALALALDGELPHHSHLPTLVGDPHAGDAVALLAAAGLVTAAGHRRRLAAGVADALQAAGYAAAAAGRVRGLAQHYTRWTGRPSVIPGQVAAEGDAVLAAAEAARREGHASVAVRLARTAAPVFGGALCWHTWERLLRVGREAARTAGEVAEQAYFHHESGIHAFCTGRPERALSELETATALRGAVADRRGAVAGRRAIALVTDSLAATHPGTPGGGRGGVATAAEAPPGGTVPAGQGPDPATAEGLRTPPAGSGSGSGPGAGATAGAAAGAFAGAGAAAASAGRDADPVDTAGVPDTLAAVHGHDGGRGGRFRRGALLTGGRRNLVAASAGVLLAAGLGTVVALGAVTEDGGEADNGTPEHSVSRDDGGLLTGEESPSGETRRPASSSSPGDGGPSLSGPSSSRPATSGSPTEAPSRTPGGEQSSAGSSSPDEDAPRGDDDSAGPSTPPQSSPGTSGGGSGGSSDGGSSGGSADGGASGGGDGSGTDGGGSGSGSPSASPSGSPSPSSPSESPSPSTSSSPSSSPSSDRSGSPSPSSSPSDSPSATDSGSPDGDGAGPSPS